MAVDDKPCGCRVAQYCAKCWDASFGALQAMTADNARLCEIALKADALAAAVEREMRSYSEPNWARIQTALVAYKVARNGQ